VETPLSGDSLGSGSRRWAPAAEESADALFLPGRRKGTHSRLNRASDPHGRGGNSLLTMQIRASMGGDSLPEGASPEDLPASVIRRGRSVVSTEQARLALGAGVGVSEHSGGVESELGRVNRAVVGVPLVLDPERARKSSATSGRRSRPSVEGPPGRASVEGGPARASGEGGQGRASGEGGHRRASGEGGQGRASGEGTSAPRAAALGAPAATASSPLRVPAPSQRQNSAELTMVRRTPMRSSTLDRDRDPALGSTAAAGTRSRGASGHSTLAMPGAEELPLLAGRGRELSRSLSSSMSRRGSAGIILNGLVQAEEDAGAPGARAQGSTGMRRVRRGKSLEGARRAALAVRSVLSRGREEVGEARDRARAAARAARKVAADALSRWAGVTKTQRWLGLQAGVTVAALLCPDLVFAAGHGALGRGPASALGLSPTLALAALWGADLALCLWSATQRRFVLSLDRLYASRPMVAADAAALAGMACLGAGTLLRASWRAAPSLCLGACQRGGWLAVGGSRLLQALGTTLGMHVVPISRRAVDLRIRETLALHDRLHPEWVAGRMMLTLLAAWLVVAVVAHAALVLLMVPPSVAFQEGAVRDALQQLLFRAAMVTAVVLSLMVVWTATVNLLRKRYEELSHKLYMANGYLDLLAGAGAPSDDRDPWQASGWSRPHQASLAAPLLDSPRPTFTGSYHEQRTVYPNYGSLGRGNAAGRAASSQEYLIGAQDLPAVVGTMPAMASRLSQEQGPASPHSASRYGEASLSGGRKSFEIPGRPPTVSTFRFPSRHEALYMGAGTLGNRPPFVRRQRGSWFPLQAPGPSYNKRMVSIVENAEDGAVRGVESSMTRLITTLKRVLRRRGPMLSSGFGYASGGRSRAQHWGSGQISGAGAMAGPDGGPGPGAGMMAGEAFSGATAAHMQSYQAWVEAYTHGAGARVDRWSIKEEGKLRMSHLMDLSEMATPPPAARRGEVGKKLLHSIHEVDFTKLRMYDWDPCSLEDDLPRLRLHVMAMFHDLGLFENALSSVESVYELVTKVAGMYKKGNKYHNWTHAVDVTHSLYTFLYHTEVGRLLDPVDKLTMMVAAVIHDVGHFGVSNAFLKETEHDMAITYNDTAIQENMHLAHFFRLIKEKPRCDPFAQLDRPQRNQARRCIIEVVLSTDMALHFDTVGDLGKLAADIDERAASLDHGIDSPRRSQSPSSGLLLEGDGDGAEPGLGATGQAALQGGGARKKALIEAMEDEENKFCILSSLLHMADLGAQLKPPEVAREWGNRVMTEFFDQGSKEKSLGLPVSPMCDKDQMVLPDSQMSFMEAIILPMASDMLALVPEMVEHQLVHNMRRTYSMWAEELVKHHARLDVPEEERQSNIQSARDREAEFRANCEGIAAECLRRINHGVDDSLGKSAPAPAPLR